MKQDTMNWWAVEKEQGYNEARHNGPVGSREGVRLQ